MKKREEQKTESIKEKLSDLARLTLLGSRELYVENFKSVLIYTDTEIQLNTGTYILKISGNNLRIVSITSDMAYVDGAILELKIQNHL